MDGAAHGHTFGVMKTDDLPQTEMTAGDMLLFVALLTAHGSSIGPDTVNDASSMLALLHREHDGAERCPGVHPVAAARMRALLRFSGQPVSLGVSAAQVSREDEPIAYATAVSRMKKLADEIAAARSVLFDCLPEFREANLAPLLRLASEVLRDRDRAGNVWMKAMGQVGSRYVSVEKMVRDLAEKLAAVRSDQAVAELATLVGDIAAQVGLPRDASPEQIKASVTSCRRIIELQKEQVAKAVEQWLPFFPGGDRAAVSADISLMVWQMGSRIASLRALLEAEREKKVQMQRESEALLRANTERSQGLTALAERLGLAPKGRLVTDAALLEEIGRAVADLQARQAPAGREGVEAIEALAEPQLPQGFEVVEPSRPGRWAIGDRSEVFESSLSLADAIRMCRETALRRSKIG